MQQQRETFAMPTYRPEYAANDLLIYKNRYQSRYVPTSLVPDEINLKIGTNSATFVFSYSVSEIAAPERKQTNSNVGVTVGKHTSKLLMVSIDFQDANFDSLLMGISEAILVLGRTRNVIARDSIRKSYDIIIRFLYKAKSDIAAMREKIMDAFKQIAHPK